MVTASLSNQTQMLLEAQNLGVNIGWVELGNELWDDNNMALGYVDTFPTAHDYAREALRWIDSLRPIFPNTRFALKSLSEDSLAPNGTPVSQRAFAWNPSIETHLDSADAVVFHYYFPLTGVTPANPNLTQVLSKPFELWPKYRSGSIDSLKNGEPVWVTEYNLNDGNQTNFIIASSWSHGLFTATMLSQLLSEPRIEMALCHQLFGPPTWGALDAFYLSPADTSSLDATAMGAALALMHGALAPMDSLQALSFSNNPTQNFGTTTFPALVGWQGIGPDSARAVVLNLSGQTQLVDAGDLFALGFNALNLSHPNPLLKGIRATSLVRTTRMGTDTLSLPPYSLTALSGPRPQSPTSTLHPQTGHTAIGRPLQCQPNPARGQVLVQNVGATAKVLIADATGRSHQTHWLQEGANLRVNLENCPPGVYVLHIQSTHSGHWRSTRVAVP